jgi:hypothetical protein
MAIALSDAYYGDGGSMATLYRFTGKPMLLQNTAVPVKHRLTFAAVCETEDTLWAVDSDFNALYAIWGHNLEARYVGSFPGEKVRGGWLYSHILYHGDVLYFAPALAGAIAAYDLSAGSFERIGLPAVNMPDETRAKFTKIVEARGRLFFVPAYFPGILELDAITRKLVLIDGWLKVFDEHENAEMYYFSDASVDEGRSCLLLTSSRANIVVEIGLDTYVVAVRKLCDDEDSFMRIALSGGAAWLLLRNRPGLARLNLSDGATPVYECARENLHDEETPMFQGMHVSGDILYLLPWNADRIVSFNTSENTYSIAGTFAAQKFRYLRPNGADIHLMDTESRFYSFSPETGHVREGCVTLETLEDCVALDAYLQGGADSPIPREDSVLRTLDSYLDALSRPELSALFSASPVVNSDGGAGKRIYEYCKREALRP